MLQLSRGNGLLERARPPISLPFHPPPCTRWSISRPTEARQSEFGTGLVEVRYHLEGFDRNRTRLHARRGPIRDPAHPAIVPNVNPIPYVHAAGSTFERDLHAFDRQRLFSGSSHRTVRHPIVPPGGGLVGAILYVGSDGCIDETEPKRVEPLREPHGSGSSTVAHWDHPPKVLHVRIISGEAAAQFVDPLRFCCCYRFPQPLPLP